MNATVTDAEVLERQAQPGWLLPYLLAADIADLDFSDLDKKARKAANIQETAPTRFTGWGRWAYWLWTIEYNRLPAEPIPQIPFQHAPEAQDAKAVQDWLQYSVRRHWTWYDEAWLWLVKWLLHGFGFTGMGVAHEIERLPEDVKVQWYRQVNIANLLHSPCDWSAHVLQGGLADDRAKRSPWAHSTGFFATPLEVCNLMAQMSFEMNADKLTDTRVLTVCDPCCGTGSTLLAASNYSLRLFGQDIVGDLCLCSILNGYLWMPWLVVMPDETEQMLTAHAQQLDRFRIMRDLLTRPDVKPQPLRESAPTGIAVSDSLQTRALADERRQSAEAFYEAVKNGALEQMSLL